MLGTVTSVNAASSRVSEFDIGRFDFCDSHAENLSLLARVEGQVDEAASSIRTWEQANVELVRQGILLAGAIANKDECRTAFDAGREMFREELASAFAHVKQNEAYEKTTDEDVRRARLDLAAQWIQEEANRRALTRIQKDSKNPAVRWARAQASARMKHVALNSVAVVSLVFEEFGMPEPVTLGTKAAWQATQLAERHGVPSELFQQDQH